MTASKRSAKQPAPRGRASTFTQALADEICDRLAKGEPLAQICRDEHMPAPRTVSDWKASHESFATDFAHAREEGFDAIAADCLAIADTPIEGKRTKVSEDGKEVVVEDMLGHRKLQVETRLKLLAKWDPKRYGDRVQADVNHTGLSDVLASITGSALKPVSDDGG